jgi:hypothetical protein
MCLRMQVMYWYEQKLRVQDGLLGCRVCCCFVGLVSTHQVPCHFSAMALSKPGLLLPLVCVV